MSSKNGGRSPKDLRHLLSVARQVRTFILSLTFQVFKFHRNVKLSIVFSF